MCTVNVDAPCVVLPGTVAGPQVRTPELIAQLVGSPQPAPASAIDQSRPAFTGNVSVNVTPCASPEPSLYTVNVNPIDSPAFTCAASAVFTIWIAGAATHVEAESLSEPSFVVATSPVLSITPLPSGQPPPVAAVVGEVMCTVNVDAACVVPAGTVAGPQVRTPELIAQLVGSPQPAPASAIDQSRPAFTGNVSVNVTPCASPEPSLYTVNVNPIDSPAFTCAASAVFTILMSAALITSVSSAQAEETGPVLLLSPE